MFTQTDIDTAVAAERARCAWLCRANAKLQMGSSGAKRPGAYASDAILRITAEGIESGFSPSDVGLTVDEIPSYEVLIEANKAHATRRAK